MTPKLTKYDLASLFELENIRTQKSLCKLGQWGGIDGLLQNLKTDKEIGIGNNNKDYHQRIHDYGDNSIIIKNPKTIFQLILDNFEDDMLRILCAASLISLILGIATEGLKQGWIQGASILVAVIIIVTVTAGNNYIKELQFQKLYAMASQKDVEVKRGTQTKKISVQQLLVGDIVEVRTGEIISVDGILIQANGIIADQSALTGQPVEIKKRVPAIYEEGANANPFLISGSKILAGSGVMVVVAVGVNSFNGKIKLTLQQDNDQTPLQQKLSVLAQQVGLIGTISAGATFGAMLLHYIYDVAVSGNFFSQFFSTQTLHELIQYFIIAVSIIVVAVPEGLPLSVTIALAYSVGQMKQEKNLVRYLQACQTMGGANNICSDKTGTLTKNLMQVTNIYIEEKTIEVIAPEIVEPNTAQKLCLCVCNTSQDNPLIKIDDSNNIIVQQSGNKTDCALLEMAYKMNYDYTRFRMKSRWRKFFPFSSDKKMNGTVYQGQKGRIYAFIKGAPDQLIHSCTKYINQVGHVAQIDQSFQNNFNKTLLYFSNQSLRTILLVYKQINTIPDTFQEMQNELIVIGLVGIKDPLREGIPQAVKKCQRAGVTVRMVTGDARNTAIAIAKQALILVDSPSYHQYTIMQGKKFRQLVGGIKMVGKKGKKKQKIVNLSTFKQIASQLRVLARSSPYDKYLLVAGLKQIGNVVAVTGDGTNDAPALKKADIGFAMGIAGTQVAKDASGIILLDDNFRSIVTAMKWGRNIFDSIRKFLQFQLTVNFVALVMAFIGGAFLRESPLNPIQMLWVNLIMDTLASLALATEPPADELLRRKPYQRRESLITATMWKNVIAQGIFQIIILGTILFKGPQIFGIPSSIGVSQWNEQTGKHYSIFFNVFVLLQIFNEINARKLKPNQMNVFEDFFNNPLFIIIVMLTILIQLIMIRYGGKSLKTIELSFEQNLLCLLIGSSALFSGFIIKVILPENLIICLYGIEIGSWKFYWKTRPKQSLIQEQIGQDEEEDEQEDEEQQFD